MAPGDFFVHVHYLPINFMHVGQTISGDLSENMYTGGAIEPFFDDR